MFGKGMVIVMKKRIYRALSLALALVLTVSSVEFPVYAVETAQELTDVSEMMETPESSEILEETGIPEVLGTSEAQEDFIPLLNYHAIPGEGEYESVREHLPEDMLFPDGGAYEATYNPLKNTSDKYLPALRNQGGYGTCWAHASMAAAEIGLTKNKGVLPSAIDLSELQLAYFMYHTPTTDPLGLVSGDSNSTGNGHDYLKDGGNVNYAKKIMQGWITARDDAGEWAYSTENAESTRTQTPDDESAYNNKYHLQNYRNTTVSGSMSDAEREDAKKLIKEYGALAVSYCHEDANFKNNADNTVSSFYCKEKKDTNHAVVIVGWDDDYSKELFKDEPKGNGAWLIRNSWTKGDQDGNWDGNYTPSSYFWMSYYDMSLTGGVALEFESADNYSNNYHYDAAAVDAIRTLSSGGKIANVFTVKGKTDSERLEAVSFDTDSTNVKYVIDVYKNLQNVNNPESGEHCGSTTGTTNYSGYYTVKLDDFVPLEKGKTFSVVITVSHADNSEVRMIQESSNDGTGWFKSKASSKNGESFYYSENSWIDNGTDGNIRIKAFTQDTGTLQVVDATGLSLSKTSLSMKCGEKFKLAAKVEPNEATNKDIIWSSSNEKVVTVSGGWLTAVGVGEDVTITATLDKNSSITATCTVSVNPALKITGGSYNETGSSSESVQFDNLIYKKEFTINAQIFPENIASNYTLKWVSSAPDVVKVEADGTAVGLKAGTAEITVTAIEDASLTDTVSLKVAQLDYPHMRTYTYSGDDNRMTVYWNSVEGAACYKVSLYDASKHCYGEHTTSELFYKFEEPVEVGKTYKCYIRAFDEDNILSSSEGLYYSCEIGQAYKVTYELDGGTNHAYNPDWVMKGQYYRLYAASKEGYVFQGWYEDAAFTKRIYTVNSPTKEITLYAKYLPVGQNYTVHYETNGGSVLDDDVVKKGEYLGVKRIPTKPGYTFVGWYTDAEFTTPYDFFKPVPGDITLYAKWEKIAVYYTISYVTNGGSAVDAESVKEGGTASKPDNPVRSGYRFAGWYADEELTAAYDFSEAVKKNLTLYAKWVVVYRISYYDGSTKLELEPSEYEEGEEFDLPDPPDRADQAFLGWFTDSELTGEIVTRIPAGSKSDLSFYGKWKQVQNYYDVVFNVNGGSEVASQRVGEDKKVLEPVKPVKEGHRFAGWFTDAEFTAAYDFSEAVKKDLTLYAKWVVVYQISYYDGTKKLDLEPSDYEEGEVLTLPVPPEREDYDFLGWYTDEGLTVEAASTIPTDSKKNLVFYGKWKYLNHTVSFVTNGDNTIKAQTVKEGKQVSRPVNPVRSGYRFAGWYMDEEFTTEYDFSTPVTKDLTLYAKWIAVYQIRYYDGTQEMNLEPSSYEEGETPMLPVPPEREDFLFEGWFTNTAGTGEAVTRIPAGSAKNFVFYGKWKDIAVYYDVKFLAGEGIEVKDQRIKRGKTASKPADPVKEGFKFAGWYTDAELTKAYDFTAAVTDHLTLHAKWAAAHKISYYDGETALSLEPAVYGEGEELALPVPPEKKDHLFEGWFASKELTGEAVTKIPAGSKSDLTFYGKWKVLIKNYSVKFIANGGSETSELTVEEGKPAVKPANPVRTGYEFVGWYLDSACTMTYDFAAAVKGDITLYAKWRNVSGISISLLDEDGNEVDSFSALYTGKAITPAISVFYNGEELTSADYSVKYENNVKAAGPSAEKKPTVAVTGKGRFTGTYKLYFTIEQVDLESLEYMDTMTVAEGQKVTPVISFNGANLKASDYTVSYGSGTMKVTGQGNFKGDIEITVNVVPKAELKSFAVKVDTKKKLYYNGENQLSDIMELVKVTDKKTGKELDADSDYVVYAAGSVVNAGSHSVIIAGIGEYSGIVQKKLTINPLKLGSGSVNVNVATGTVYYDADGAKVSDLKVTGTSGGKTFNLTEGIDYTVSYSNNKKVGSKAKVKVAFKGNFKGTKAVSKGFTIVPLSLESSADVNVLVSDKTGCTKKGVYKQKPSVTLNGTLLKSSDYTVKYYTDAEHRVEMSKKNPVLVEAGEDFAVVYVEIKGKGNYKDSYFDSYKVYRKNEKYKDISKAKVTLKEADLSCTGEELTPAVEYVTLNGEALSPNCYEVLYFNNVKPGTAKVMIKGKEEDGYCGSAIGTFRIRSYDLNTVLSRVFY